MKKRIASQNMREFLKLKLNKDVMNVNTEFFQIIVMLHKQLRAIFLM
jgi:hypothetical protein